MRGKRLMLSEGSVLSECSVLRECPALGVYSALGVCSVPGNCSVHGKRSVPVKLSIGDASIDHSALTLNAIRERSHSRDCDRDQRGDTSRACHPVPDAAW